MSKPDKKEIDEAIKNKKKAFKDQKIIRK